MYVSHDVPLLCFFFGLFFRPPRRVVKSTAPTVSVPVAEGKTKRKERSDKEVAVDASSSVKRAKTGIQSPTPGPDSSTASGSRCVHCQALLFYIYYGLKLMNSGAAGSASQKGTLLRPANSNRAAGNLSRPASVASSQPDVGHVGDGDARYVLLTVRGIYYF